MTDNEIIEALECCKNGKCITRNCPYSHYPYEGDECHPALAKAALDLINRQKAEIERLKGCVKSEEEVRVIANATVQAGIGIIKAEAVKEFAERLKEYVESYDVTTGYKITIVNAVEEETIDNLVKEWLQGSLDDD